MITECASLVSTAEAWILLAAAVSKRARKMQRHPTVLMSGTPLTFVKGRRIPCALALASGYLSEVAELLAGSHLPILRIMLVGVIVPPIPFVLIQDLEIDFVEDHTQQILSHHRGPA